MRRPSSLDEHGGQRKLVRRQAERLARQRGLDAFHLVEYAARLDHPAPRFRRAFTFAQAGLGRLFRDRLVGKNADPDLAAALEITRERDARGLDLARAEPAALQRFEAVVAERERRAAQRHAGPAPLLLF